MKQNTSRRDFLKLAGAYSIGAFTPQFLVKPGLGTNDSNQKNILIIVFDALSSHHISLYGYERATMPNLSRLADKAIVYHNHYSPGNFTTPGTASLLTGTLPWTHRATMHNDTVVDEFVKKNIFSIFEQYHRLAYTHNPLANTILQQFFGDIDNFIDREELLLVHESVLEQILKADNDIAEVSLLRSIKQKNEIGYSYSLFIARIYEVWKKNKIRELESIMKHFPGGIPEAEYEEYFTLEEGIDFVNEILFDVSKPFLGYFHFFPPHHPYRTRKEFYGKFFQDDYHLPRKLNNPLSDTQSYKTLLNKCQKYDEFICYVDSEFSRFYELLEQQGLLDKTLLVLTSDHGELFERGTLGHTTRLLYQPVIKIPLIMWDPEINTRIDIHNNTSSIDVLPTLLFKTDQTIPNWLEGNILPPFVDLPSTKERNIYSFETRKETKGKLIDKATATLIRGEYKIIYYFGYEELDPPGELIELYNIKSDPEEMKDISKDHHILAVEMVDLLKSKLEEINLPYV
jgi:arylsulfatase A-like enzyme